MTASSIGGRRLGGSIAAPAIGGCCVLGITVLSFFASGSGEDSAASAFADRLLNQVDRIQQAVGRRRTPRYVHVDGNDGIDALDDGVVIEHSAGTRAGTHRY